MIFPPVDRGRLISAIVRRRSIRGYKPDAVPDDVLARVIDAARLAPSARNRQPWRFIIVRDDGIKRELARIAKEQMFIATAPVVIALASPTSDYVMTCCMPAHIIDLAIAGEHICLQAAEEGLGTCWIGWFKEKKIRKILHIPKGWKIISLLALGYSQKENNPYTSRLNLDDILFFNGIK